MPGMRSRPFCSTISGWPSVRLPFDKTGLSQVRRGIGLYSATSNGPNPRARSTLPAAMPRPFLPPLASPGAMLALLLTLPGCQALLTETTSTVAGITGASIASGVGADPAVTTGIGLGVQALGRAGLQYAQRRTHRAAQDRIAAAAGPLPLGVVAPWRTSHTVPVEANEHGQVAVSRLISTGPLDCKEILFSVEAGSGTELQQAFYLAAICRDGARWKWASAEPATERWGSLQ